MKKITVIIILFLAVTLSKAQYDVEFFPSGLNVKPFAANILEPKLGFIFYSGNELRLDIGNSLDLVAFNSYDADFAIGADFFTWSLLRREDGFKFPVDAVDYLFGLNFSYKRTAHDYAFGFRARLSHISAHFVDGHYNWNNNTWLNGVAPRVYSREFIEVMPFYQFKYFRFYVGFTYLFHVQPASIKKDNYQAGFEYYRKDLIMDNVSPYVAYDFSLVHLSSTRTANHSVTAGVKVGKPEGRGISLYFQYYTGKGIHGEYFDFNESYSGFGLNLDL